MKSRVVLVLVLMLSAIGSAQPRPEMQRIPQFENERAVSWKSVIPPHTESTIAIVRLSRSSVGT
jgi:hypothetical protein